MIVILYSCSSLTFKTSAGFCVPREIKSNDGGEKASGTLENASLMILSFFQNMESTVTTMKTNLEQSYLNELTTTRKDLEKQHAQLLAKLRKELGLEFSVS